MKKRRILIAAAAILIAFSSCAKDKTPTDKQTPKQPEEQIIQEQTDINEEQPAISPETVEEQTEENTVEEQPAPEIEEIGFVNPLTGEKSEKDLSNVRPISVMMNNIYQALPQIGIKNADIVYEILEEGGITRLLCIFNDFAEIPELGSIRSARDYFIDVADAHDAIFVHAGRSTYADTELRRRGTNNIDGLYAGNFYRSKERRKTMATEHTLMISGEGIMKNIDFYGYRTTSEKPCPLTFGNEYLKGETTANHIEVPFAIGNVKNVYMTGFFDYDAETGLYAKGHFNEAHVDGTDGSQLMFKNVITLTCPMNQIKGDKLGCIQVHFTGEGKGTYSVDGTQREITWKKASRSSEYTLYEADGITPLVLAPGKSYIALVPTGTSLVVK